MNTMSGGHVHFSLWNVLRFWVSVSITLGSLSPAVALAAPAPAASSAPFSVETDLGLLLSQNQTTRVGAELLPAWMPAATVEREMLPGWYASPPAAPVTEKQLCPAGSTLLRAIPASLLTIDVAGPAVASVGSPVGSGEVYTAVIRNSSTDTAYGVYLTASHPSFFTHDGGDQLISSTGTIPLSAILVSSTGITWTPAMTLNLVPGEVITLNFKLRAACDAQSAQRMEIGVHYNADEGELPDEVNTAGWNITTGRGNLVIKKAPALQNLGTPDFGKPITWTVTVQNTGLGKLYGAVIADYGGEQLGQPSGDLNPTTTIPLLDVNEVQTYTVVGSVTACNFTNVAEGYWPCGNKVGDATVITPLKSTASVLFSPQTPNVAVQISSPLTFPYCDIVTQTVAVTITNSGGPAANFRLDSTFESEGFLSVIPGSVSSGWQYETATGVFSYTGGVPTGTLPVASAADPIILTFQVRPTAASVCAARTGSVGFTPLYADLCNGAPFTGNPVELLYQAAQGEEPTLVVDKTGPAIVTTGETFNYQITLSGENPDHIAGGIFLTDTLPAEFVPQGVSSVSTGSAVISGSMIFWSFDPGDVPGAFNETLIYTVKAITTTGGVCGASALVANSVRATARPTCPGCAVLDVTDYVETAISNGEGVFPSNAAAGSFEVCGAGGFTLVSRYLITGSAVVTWTGAVFTEALGTPIGGGALPGATPLQYQPGSLIAMINGVDYTAELTPVATSGQLVIDLSPLADAGPTVPTQNLTLILTYTVSIPEAALDGEVDQTFYDWTQLYLPGLSDTEACAGNRSFNQAQQLTISRGDLSLGLNPRILNKCSTNPVRITVADNVANRLTDHIVVTFTASSSEIRSARNFAYSGSLAAVGSISVVTNDALGGGMGMITFTLPTAADLTGNGEIQFDMDLNCTDESVWNAGVTYQSQCAIVHRAQVTRDHLYRTPGLLLFATPLKYTVREKEVLWKFFVTNNGNMTATDVLVKNTLYGLVVTGYTPDNPAGISLSGTLPITDSDVIFKIDALGPNQQRAVTVTADVIACNPLHVDISAEHGCFGTTCVNPQTRVEFDTPDPYLLTNNGESADLPMCDIGDVVFTTKNASSDVSLYHLNITETLINLTPVPGAPITVTVWDERNNQVASTTGFTPVVVTGAGELQLIWRWADAPPEVYTWFTALPPMYVVRIFVPVRTTCFAPSTPQSYASASAEGPCGKHLSYDEDALTLRTLQPDMMLLKQGRVAGGTFGKIVYASPGDLVTWRLEIDNRNTAQSYVAKNVILSDTWPLNFEFITATTMFTPQVMTGSRTILWPIGDIDPKDDPLVFLITGTVTITDGACSPSTINAARLTYGCDLDGCTNAIVPQDTARLGTIPDLRVGLSPAPLSVCQGDIPVVIRNYGSAAYTTGMTLTLPVGYVYSQVVSSGLEPTEIITASGTPEFRWDLIPGRTDDVNPYEFTLLVRIKNSAANGSCPVANGQSITATMAFDNHWTCSTPGPWTVTQTATLDVLTPVLAISKSPRTQTVDVGKAITWTVRITNSGTGAAEHVVVTDTAGSSFYNLTATSGSDGAPAVISGNVITWVLPASIAATNGVWTASVSGVLSDTGDNLNIVTATAGCATGCTTADVSNLAYATLLQRFEKNPTIQTGTIGSLVVFTFTTVLPDVDTIYRSLILTDALPTGLGYVGSKLQTTYDMDGNQGGPGTIISPTPTVSPTALATGNVIWRLGDVSGTVQINGVITAVIRDITANYAGARLVNNLSMSYIDNGQRYLYTDTADVDVQEPLLHIGKGYVTPVGCNAMLHSYTFNGLSDTGWSEAGTWTPVAGLYQNTTSSTYRRAFLGDRTWTDYSFSFMMRTNDASGGMGGYVRQNDTGTTDTGYVFLWTNTQMELRRRNTDSLLASYASGYQTNRWYHVEMRVIGSQIQVFVDGVLRLQATNSTHAQGRVGLLSYDHTLTQFDDVLVTRLGRMACPVGANDLVTYTLVVSNQAELPGYQLVITDAIPAGTSLESYTFASSDATASVLTAPTPIPGAVGTLVWNVNHLTPTVPFTALSHTALTLTVVLRVADGITANTVLMNQASLAYDGQDGTGPVGVQRAYSGGSHSTAIRTIDGGPTKGVTFTPPPTATLGTLVTYTIIVPAQPITATLYGVLITDTIDSHLSIENVVTSGGTGASAIWSGHAITATFASIPHDTRAWITITTRISDGLGAVAGQILTNSAVMTHSTATVLTTTTPVTTLVGEPRLALVKASTPPTSNTVGAGQTVTYALTITNWNAAAASPAYDGVVTDTLPVGMRNAAPVVADVTLNGAPVSGGDYSTSYDSGSGIFRLVFDPDFAVPVGGQLVIVYAARVDDGVGVRLDLTNVAELTWSSLPGVVPGERNYGPQSDDTTVHTVVPSLTKAVLPLTATVGQVVTYTLRVPQPTVTATLYAVTVTDRLNGRLQLVAVDAPDGTAVWVGNALTVTYGSIPHDVQQWITVTAVVSGPTGVLAGQVITNVAMLEHSRGVTESNRPAFTVTEPALTLVKASTPPTSNTVGAGQAVTYTLRITNSAAITASAAYDLLISDTLPAHVTLVSPIPVSVEIDGNPVASGDVAISYVGGMLMLDFEDTVALAPGSVLTVLYHGQVDVDVPAYEDQINRAELTWSSMPGSVSGDRTYGPIQGTTNIHAGAPSLALTKSADPGLVQAGEWLTYTLTVVNTGIVSATGVVVTDAVPADTAYIACTPLPCSESGGVVSWPLGTLDISVTHFLTMVVEAHTPLTNGTLITNTAWVTSTEGLTRTATVTTPVASSPQLHLSKVSLDANGGDLRPGDLLTYTLVVLNSGNANATAVVVNDTVPDHTLYVPGSISGGDARDDSGEPLLTWTINLLPLATPVTLTFAVRVATPLTDGQSIVNAAAVTSTEGITDSTKITDTVTSSHALVISKSADPTPVEAGDLLTYTVVVTVTGDEPVYGVVVSETVPQHTVLYAASDPHTVEGDSILWPLGDFLPSESGIVQATAVVSFVVTVDRPLITGTQLLNTVVVSDAEGITDTDTLTTPVVSTHQLAITKTTDVPMVAPGELLTYTLTWEVTGNEPALGVRISDTVPANTTYALCEGAPCTESGGLVIWDLGDQDPPAFGVVTLTLLVNSPLLTGTLLYNGALISDTQGLTDTDTVTIPVGSWHDFTLVKSAAPSPVVAGDLLTYTLDWTYDGNEPAFDGVIADTVPQSTTYQSCAGAPCGFDGAVVTWSLGALVPPSSGAVTLVVLVDPAFISGTQVYNSAVISDSSGLTRSHTLTTPVSDMADLEIFKSDDPDPVIVGTTLTYTLVVVNHGPSVARNVVVTDWLPPEVTFESASPAESSGPNPLVWDALGDLGVGERLTLTLRTQVLVTTTTSFVNATRVDSDTPDDRPDNNVDDEETTPLLPGLEVNKTVLPGLAAPNMPFTYVIAITNTGLVTFNAVMLTDTLPSADFHYVVGSGDPTDPDTIAGSTLVWQNLGTLAPSQRLDVAFAVTVTPGVSGTFVNVAAVEGIHPGGSITDSDDAVIGIIDPAVDVSKAVEAPGVVDGVITFTVRITNVGPSIIDILPLYDYFTGDIAYIGGMPMADVVDNASRALRWNDLTAYFGHDLVPGNSFSVITVFSITAQSEFFSARNQAVVSDAVDLYENPANEDTDEVPITNAPTAVDLRYFRAVGTTGGIRLEWATAVEVDNFGFRLLRALSPDLSTETPPDVTRASEIAFVPSLCRGNFCGAEYLYEDLAVPSDVASWYWLVDVDTEGLETVHGPVSASVRTAALDQHLYLPLVLAVWP